MIESEKLFERAVRVMPGGVNSPVRAFRAVGGTPPFIRRAAGCRLTDVDGNEYIDMSIMGIGTNTLGYGHPEVDEAVRQTIDNGNMSTFNCPEEVYLAEKLVELHPWADMVRFARSGNSWRQLL